jgi:hypothetical protein
MEGLGCRKKFPYNYGYTQFFWMERTTPMGDVSVRHNLLPGIQMNTTEINELVGGGAGVIGAALYAGLILRPAWLSYTRLWERMAAAVLTLYVLAVLVGIGVAGALAAVYFWG